MNVCQGKHESDLRFTIKHYEDLDEQEAEAHRILKVHMRILKSMLYGTPFEHIHPANGAVHKVYVQTDKGNNPNYDRQMKKFIIERIADKIDVQFVGEQKTETTEEKENK